MESVVPMPHNGPTQSCMSTLHHAVDSLVFPESEGDSEGDSVAESTDCLVVQSEGWSQASSMSLAYRAGLVLRKSSLREKIGPQHFLQHGRTSTVACALDICTRYRLPTSTTRNQSRHAMTDRTLQMK